MCYCCLSGRYRGSSFIPFAIKNLLDEERCFGGGHPLFTLRKPLPKMV
jgi:hypothetical protein